MSERARPTIGAPDEMGLGYLLPLLSCEDDAKKLDVELFLLQMAAASPLVSASTRARIAESAEAWRAFRKEHSGLGGCFGRAAVRKLPEFAETFDHLRKDVARDSLRPSAVPPTTPMAPAVISVPWAQPPEPARYVGAGRGLFFVLGVMGTLGFLGYRRLRGKQ